MSRTCGIITVEKPTQIPCVTTIQTNKSVEGMTRTQGENEELVFVVGPTLFSSPIIERQLAFSEEKRPKLDFKYFTAGEIELEGKKIFLLLEKN